MKENDVMNYEITKEEVNNLPLGGFKEEIVIVNDKETALKAIEDLRRDNIIGIDTETKPAFKKGESYDPSLIQLAREHITYLFRIQKIGLLPEIVELLADPKITKVGLALDRDIKELQDMVSFEPANMVDLNVFCPTIGFKNIGVRNLAALVLGFRISKRQRTSNWEAEELSEAQCRYAATDAWACRQIYLKLQNVK